jgi:hypothetical protein
MNEHVLDWIGAYHDGELFGSRRRWVEAHLHGCAACRAELAALQVLSAQLQSSQPMPVRTPPEQFVAQVRLRLPARPWAPPARHTLRQALGLWLPLSVVAAWALGQAMLAVSGLALFTLPALPLPTLPGLDALPWLAAPPNGWGTWSGLSALSIGLTALTAATVCSCLAGWWAARDSNMALAPAAEPAAM